jgi:hypothetical protein
MDAGTVKRIEGGVCAGAAAAFAAAVGFALYRWQVPMMVEPQLGAFAGVGTLVAFLPSWQVLRLVDRRAPDFRVPMIDLGAVARSRPAELVLTDADRLDEVLVLDHVFDSVTPDSRIVRLFDPAAMPTPGQLKARIDRHLDRGTLNSPDPDASQALYDALAELRIELPSRR